MTDTPLVLYVVSESGTATYQLATPVYYHSLQPYRRHCDRRPINESREMKMQASQERALGCKEILKA
jgi:hypothetical protein